MDVKKTKKKTNNNKVLGSSPAAMWHQQRLQYEQKRMAAQTI